MLCAKTIRELKIWGIMLVGMMALSITMVGCGDKKETGTDVVVKASPENNSVSMVTSPPPDFETSPASNQSDETIISEPEPPREITYDEAEAAYHERRFADAVELFTRYTELKSENPWGHYMLGLSAWKAGNHELALEAFERALELDPDHVKSQLNLSRVLLDTGKPWDALARLDEALAVDPESSDAYRLKGRAYHQLGQMVEAVDAYREAIRIDGQDAWSMNNLGLVFIEVERFNDALAPLARAVELRDDIAIFQNNLGMALERTGHYQAARDAYQAAVTIDGSNEKAVANLGRVEILAEEPGLEPVDLAELARGFRDEFAGLHNAGITEEVPEVVELEPFVISEVDSSVGRDGR
jgi:Flp pilus assembly protein TadD